jgi:hypothetical protein
VIDDDDDAHWMKTAETHPQRMDDSPRPVWTWSLLQQNTRQGEERQRAAGRDDDDDDDDEEESCSCCSVPAILPAIISPSTAQAIHLDHQKGVVELNSCQNSEEFLPELRGVFAHKDRPA